MRGLRLSQVGHTQSKLYPKTIEWDHRGKSRNEWMKNRNFFNLKKFDRPIKWGGKVHKLLILGIKRNITRHCRDTLKDYIYSEQF